MNARLTLGELKKEIIARGYTRCRPFRIIGELLVFVLATLAGVGMLIYGPDSFVVRSLAMLLVAWSAVGVSTNAHMASHNAISDKNWVNKALVYFGYPFFLQVSLSYWRHKHVVVHHPQPNLIGKDADANLAPYFVLTQEALESASGFRRWFYDRQWMFLPFVLFFNSFGVILAGWIYLIRQLRSSRTRQLKHWLDLLALLLHIAVWVALPLAYFSAADVMAFTIARLGLTSYGMFALFGPAHFPAEAVFLGRDIDADDPVWLQTVTTVNFRTGPLGRLLCAGVEYQIEHHLFPSIPHVWYPQLSELVRRFCEARGYPYRTLGWWEGIWKSLLVFRYPKPTFHDAEKVTEHCFTGARAENAMPGVVTPSFSERLNQARPVR